MKGISKNFSIVEGKCGRSIFVFILNPSTRSAINSEINLEDGEHVLRSFLLVSFTRERYLLMIFPGSKPATFLQFLYLERNINHSIKYYTFVIRENNVYFKDKYNMINQNQRIL